MIYNLDKIEPQIHRLRDYDLTKNFLAISIITNDLGIGIHSGIIACHNSEVTYMHFTGKIKLQTLDIFPDNMYIKELTIFDRALIGYYKTQMEIIAQEANPIYGVVFQDSFYKADGTYYSETNLPDICTCVGFCVNTIRAMMYNNSEYLLLDDWDETTLQSIEDDLPGMVFSTLEYLDQHVGGISEDLKNRMVKRIKPSELTSSAYFEAMPIPKVNVDYINPTVMQVLQVKQFI
ncbi:hypothetical protein R1T16_17390 [Flavobacterium sp. DG1-102-2]|uniref:hypothetical protein n=1 Tax=Flavobacterium sp. DG1-102-2 TaxID=3081663 RepID=UPI002949E63A|nr:hypothetical protein [Flavobacterium sp. DG1-102-2]MDV6170214.1 hypothetical protein [Flavobacterium sp. DG1-102-2]